VDERIRVVGASLSRPSSKVLSGRAGALLSSFAYRAPSRRAIAEGGRRRKSRRRSGNGIKVRVKRRGGYKLLPRSFEVRLKNGVIGIALRPKGESRRFDVLKGPSVSQVYSTLRPAMLPEINAIKKRVLLREIRFALGDD
jgi:hypothetical protein